MQNNNHTVHHTPLPCGGVRGRVRWVRWLQVRINFLQALRHIRRNMGQSILIVGIISMALTAFVFSASMIWRVTHEETYVADADNVYLVQATTPEGFNAYSYWLTDSVACAIRDHAPTDAKVGLYHHTASVEFIGTRDTTIVQPSRSVNPEYFEAMEMEFINGRPAREEREVVLIESTAMALYGTTDLEGMTVMGKVNDVQEPYRIVGVVNLRNEKSIKYPTAFVCKQIEPTPAQDFCYAPYSAEVYVRTSNPKAMQRSLDEVLEQFSTSQYNDDYTSLHLVPLRMSALLNYEGSFWKAAFYPGVFLILSTLLLISGIFSYLALLNNAADRRWTDHRLRICLGGGSRDTLLRLQAEVLLMFGAIGVLTFVLMTLSFDTFFKEVKITHTEVYMWYVGSLLVLLATLLLLCLIPVYVQNRRHRRALNGAPQGRASTLNYPLAVVQVAVSVLLVFLVWNGGRQVHFATDEVLGVNPDGVYTLDCLRYDARPVVNTPEVAQEINALATVDTCVMNHSIFERGWALGWRVDGFQHNITLMELTEGTMRLFDIKPNFWKPVEDEFQWKENQVLLSSKAKEYFGVTPDNPILNTHNKLEVIGTVDICTRDLYKEPELIAFCPSMEEQATRYLYFRFLPGKEKEGIAGVEEILMRHDITPNSGKVRIINYGDLIAEKYEREQRYLWFYSVLSVVGISIALFGLITLISADLQRQRRAIAIRRVFGAHYGDCLRRTLRTYGIISALGTLIGLCIGYYLMNLWLKTYTMQITLGFTPALGIVLLISLIITALVAYKVKVCFRENPTTVITG